MDLLRSAPRLALATASLGGAVALLSGCGQGKGPSQTQYAQLRVIDASAAAGGVDILVGSNTLAYNIGFSSVVSYAPVVPGTYALSANQTNSKDTLAATRGTLTAGNQYTLLISNTAAGLQSQLFTDRSAAAPVGQSMVRLIDQAALLGAVDIYFVPAGGSLLTSKPVATSVALNSMLSGISVPSNTYQVILLPAGTVPTPATATTAATVPLYTSAATSLPAGSVRTLVLLDTQITTTPAVQLLILSDYDAL